MNTMHMRPTLSIGAAILFSALTGSGLRLACVHGQSMMPTLQSGDCLLALRVPRVNFLMRSRLGRILICRRAIVLVRPPAHLQRLEVKRVTALPGDLCVWGWGDSEIDAREVPHDHVFITGDAAKLGTRREDRYPLGRPSDSRLYGPCPMSAVVGRVILRYWPLSRVGYPQ